MQCWSTAWSTWLRKSAGGKVGAVQGHLHQRLCSHGTSTGSSSPGSPTHAPEWKNRSDDFRDLACSSAAIECAPAAPTPGRQVTDFPESLHEPAAPEECSRQHWARQGRGRYPIVVQSMTNTDTADIEGTAQQVKSLARAGSELVRVTVNTAEAAAAVAPIRDRLAQLGRERADHRRLPLQRAQAAARIPGVRRSAREVSHQSRQRRSRQQARSAVRGDDRDRVPLQQARAHRRELGQPRSGSADASDGREQLAAPSRSRRSRSCARPW